MRAIEITQPGGPEVLQLCERPMPVPGPGQVLIKVHAAGINRPDVLQRTAIIPCPRARPTCPAWKSPAKSSAATWPMARWKRATGVRPGAGRRLCGILRGRRQACLPGARRHEPGGSGVPAGNVFHRLEQCLRPRPPAPGETFLVQGGSSGIGVTAIQLAKALGHTVYATAGSDEKCRACEDWAPTAPSITRQKTSSKWSSSHRRPRRRRHPRHGGRRLRAPRNCLPGRRRPPGLHRPAGRRQGHRAAGTDPDAPPDFDGLDTAAPPRGLQGRHRRASCASTSGPCSMPARSSR